LGLAKIAVTKLLLIIGRRLIGTGDAKVCFQPIRIFSVSNPGSVLIIGARARTSYINSCSYNRRRAVFSTGKSCKRLDIKESLQPSSLNGKTIISLKWFFFKRTIDA
jgi:hypothetical protein